jgi:cholesterol oxidase
MPDFDAIVIGSGFGGAITGCRLAEAGYKVLILERGRRWSFEEKNKDFFPRELDDADRWFWDNDDPVRRHGWIDLRVFPSMTVAQGAGVGGGSLIYANISVKAPKQAFEDYPGLNPWPAEIRLAELEPYYGKVGREMQVRPLPDEQWSGRTHLMKEAAEAIGQGDRFRLVELAVRFDDNLKFDPASPDRPRRDPASFRPNEYGILQGTCYHCGMCDIGCDVNARNTLDLNYIPRAERHGAKVWDLHQVTNIEPQDGGYRVSYERLDSDDRPPGSATARLVILAAGSLGSTELLLRCRDVSRSLRGLSPQLGCHWSSNGDFLTPAYYPHRQVHPAPSEGPPITAVIDFLDRSQGGQSFWIQDGGFPDILAQYVRKVGTLVHDARAWLMLGAIQMTLSRAPAAAEENAPEPDPAVGVRRRNPVSRLMPWFAQAVDASNGVLRLKRKFLLFGPPSLHLDWDVTRSKPAIDAVVAMHKRLSEATDGQALVPPSWSLFHGLITPHPLGGCGMGETPDRGVVDPKGEVFGHRNLYVADGAVFPRAIGVNPSRTIGALAERIAHHIVQQGR